MLRKLSSNQGLVRNILTLFTGSTIAQAIPVFISPILTRYYPVSDFATLTVVATLISLVGVVVAGRYEIGIGLPASDREARQMVMLAMMISVLVSVFSFVILIFFRHQIAVLLKNPEASEYILFVPLAALFYGLYQSLSYWNIRNRNYSTLAASRVSQSIVNSGVSLGYAFTGLGMNGLVFGNVSGQLAALFWTWIRTRKKGIKAMVFKKDEAAPAELKALALRYADLPRVNGIHALSDMMQTTLIIFLISGFFGMIATGLYGFTMRILQAPLNMIGSSFSIVFYKEVSEKINKNERITKLVRTTMRTLAMLSFPVFLGIMIWGPELFAFVFGASWREAGLYARILSPWLFLNFISSPLSHLPVILNQQRRFFLYSLIGNLAVVASLALGSVIFRDITRSLILVATVQVLFQGSMIYFFMVIAGRSERMRMQES